MGGVTTSGYAVSSPTSELRPIEFELRPLRPTDVHIKVKFCGVCHSDIHTARNEWNKTRYPAVVGHEISGHIVSVGSEVRRFSVGEPVGVGCMVDACLKCPYCKGDRELNCRECVLTYNGVDREDHMTVTKGGYARDIIVNEHFVVHMNKIPLDRGAPLMCCGITVFSPIKHYGFDRKGGMIGVVGLGGLGHMAVMILRAKKVGVVVFSSTEAKREFAITLGASDFVLTADERQMKKYRERLDGIIDTVAVAKDPNPYIDLLKPDGKLCLLGIPKMPIKFEPTVSSLIFKRKTVCGSLYGGMAETKEMLKWCYKHECYPIVTKIPIEKINEAFQSVVNKDVKFRYVIDMDASGVGH